MVLSIFGRLSVTMNFFKSDVIIGVPCCCKLTLTVNRNYIKAAKFYFPSLPQVYAFRWHLYIKRGCHQIGCFQNLNSQIKLRLSCKSVFYVSLNKATMIDHVLFSEQSLFVFSWNESRSYVILEKALKVSACVKETCVYSDYGSHISFFTLD